MKIIQLLQKQFEGRGIFPTFFSIVSWVYLVIILSYIMCQFLLYVFRVKCNDKNFFDNLKESPGKDNKNKIKS
ncbi:hypothetical protein [Clostridium sp. JN-1]|jgi:hypothetical protein|uniref:hypothetical protein n=1 Tax=Clostridium sp. JN-1 TaxID=2483110 RepID=UPI000F0AFB2A|nr:hypothetical protein [Clostridium sp. JN-1]